MKKFQLTVDEIGNATEGVKLKIIVMLVRDWEEFLVQDEIKIIEIGFNLIRVPEFGKCIMCFQIVYGCYIFGLDCVIVIQNNRF